MARIYDVIREEVRWPYAARPVTEIRVNHWDSPVAPDGAISLESLRAQEAHRLTDAQRTHDSLGAADVFSSHRDLEQRTSIAELTAGLGSHVRVYEVQLEQITTN